MITIVSNIEISFEFKKLIKNIKRIIPELPLIAEINEGCSTVDLYLSIINSKTIPASFVNIIKDVVDQSEFSFNCRVIKNYMYSLDTITKLIMLNIDTNTDREYKFESIKITLID